MMWLVLFLASQFTPRTAIDFRQPQLASAGGTVAVTFASEHAIYYSQSSDAGATWTAPAVVTQLAGTVMLGNHRGPRIAFAGGGTMVISAIVRRSATAEGDLKTWRSLDGGKTWSAGPDISDLPGAAREGLHAMAASKDGRLFATWLDLRNLVPGKPGTELWGAYSADGGATWSKNFAVYRSPDGSICSCCHPSALFDTSGSLIVMWRNVLKGNRDIYLVRSSDGGKTFAEPEKIGAASWALDACPMDGGGLVQNGDGKIVTVWRRENTVYLAAEGGAETVLHAGKNPAVAFSKNGLYAAWNSPDGVYARVPGRSEPLLLDHEGGFVTLTAASSGTVLAAWERKGTIQFHTLP